MTTSEIPHHRHRYPQGDLPPLATPGKNSLHASAARGQTNRHSDDPAAVRRHLAGCRSRPELHRAMRPVGSGVVSGGLRPRLLPARLWACVSEAVRPETAENRLGQRRLLLAPPQLHLQLHDRNRRSVGVSLALGGAWCSPVAADDRFRPQRHVLVSRHRAAGAKQSGGNHRPRLGTVARAYLVADEHHADWAGQKGYIPTTVGGGCILGVALTASADDVHLQEAYGVFAA